jgi:hypothetical protein
MMTSSERNNGRVLEKKQCVSRASFLDGKAPLVLDTKRLFVPDEAGKAYGHNAPIHAGTQASSSSLSITAKDSNENGGRSAFPAQVHAQD